MAGIKVPPGALRAFAGDCRETAESLEAIDASGVATGVSAGLADTSTAAALSTAAADLEAAFGAVATRHRTMADIADGTQGNYDVTEQQIVDGFAGMSHR